MQYAMDQVLQGVLRTWCYLDDIGTDENEEKHLRNVYPLNSLLKINHTWVWSHEHQKAFLE